MLGENKQLVFGIECGSLSISAFFVSLPSINVVGELQRQHITTVVNSPLHDVMKAIVSEHHSELRK